MKADPEAPLWPAPGARRARELIGIGQNAFDRLCRVGAPPPPAGKAPMLDYAELPGGQVATAVLACARLGLRTAYVGAVGDDGPGELVLDPLRRAGVDLTGVVRVAGAATQAGVILVDDASGERSVLWHRDPRLRLEPGCVPRERIESARALLLDSGDLDAAIWAARVARRAGTAIVLDADRVDPGIETLLELVDFPLVSREFAETYGKGGSLTRALEALVAAGARLAAVTLGSRGAIARTGQRQIESPGFPVAVRDTTGAGDAFHGGFVAALLEGLGAEPALRWANAVAALNCRGEGAQGGLPGRRELDAFLREAEPGAGRLAARKGEHADAVGDDGERG